MRTIQTNELKAGNPLPGALYHRSGELLVPASDRLDGEALALFERFGIREVLTPEKGEKVAEFVHGARNTRLDVDDLNPGERMSKPLFDRGGALLLDAGAAVSSSLPGALRHRGVTTIFVRKSAAVLRLEQARAFVREYRGLRRRASKPPAPAEAEIQPARLMPPEKINLRELDAMVEKKLEIRAARAERSLADEIVQRPGMEARSEREKGSYVNLHGQLIDEIRALFECLAAGTGVDVERVGRLARGIVGGLLQDRDLLLNLAHLRTGDYLLDHSLATAIFAIHIATALGYDQGQVLEVAYGGLLHDVGMTRVAPDIREKPGKLTSVERMEIYRHPIYSLDILQHVAGNCSGIPISVPFVAYQSHERENGKGYPKGRRASFIHDYAKIVAAADTFAAAGSTRPYRSAKLPYRAMEEVILMGARRELNADVIKGMLAYVSLFPVGSFVELEGERVARVVAGNRKNYAKPVVSVLYEGGRRLDPPVRIDLADGDVHILRAVSPPENGDDVMDGF